MPDEPSVKSGEAEENLDIVYAAWERPLRNSLDARRLHGYALGGDDVPKEGDFGSVELTLREIDVKVCSL